MSAEDSLYTSIPTLNPLQDLNEEERQIIRQKDTMDILSPLLDLTSDFRDHQRNDLNTFKKNEQRLGNLENSDKQKDLRITKMQDVNQQEFRSLHNWQIDKDLLIINM